MWEQSPSAYQIVCKARWTDSLKNSKITYEPPTQLIY
jgi:hypothetical protein